MRRDLHIGDFHPALESAFRERIREWCPRGDARGVLVVVPTRRLGIHLRRRLAQLDTATVGLAPRSLDELIDELAAPGLAAGELTALAPWVESALVAEISRRSTSGEADAPSTAGWSRAYAATFRELRDAGISARELERGLTAAGLEAVARLGRLARLYRRFEEALNSRGLADSARRCDLAAGEAGAFLERTGVRAVFLYGFTSLLERERRVVAALIECSPVEAFLPGEGGLETSPAFAATQPLRDWLLREQGFDVRPRGADLPWSDQLTLRHRLFADLPVERRATPAPSGDWRGDGSVRWLSSPAASRETREVLRRLVARPANSTLVLLRDEGPGAAAYREASRATGVALQVSPAPLAETPVGRAAHLLVQLAAERTSSSQTATSDLLSRSRIEELLSCGGLAAETFGEGSRPGRWIQALRGRRLVGGLEAWQRFLARYGPAAAQSALPFEDRREEDAEEAERDPWLEKELPSIGFWIDRLFADLAAVAAPVGSWRRAAERWATFWTRWLVAGSDRDALLAPLAEWSSLSRALRPTPVHVRAALEAALAAAEPLADDAPRFGEAPAVSSVGASCGLTAERVVVPALVERVFPRASREDPVLRDAERRQLNDAFASGRKPSGRLPLRREEARVEERLLFRLAVAAARDELLLAWPRRGPEGRRLVPSSFLLAAVRAVLGRPVHLAELDGDGAQEPGSAGQELPVDIVSLARRGGGSPSLPSLLESEADLRALASGGAGGFAVLASRSGLAAGLLADRKRHGFSEREHLSEFDGLLDPDFAGRWLTRRRAPDGGAVRLSASALETYGKCSFRFLHREILRVSAHPPPERLLDLDAAARGRLVHALLAELYRRVLERDLWPLATAERLAEAQALVDPLLEEIVAARPSLVGELAPSLWSRRRRSLAEDARRLLALEAQEPGEWRPWRLEAAFGSGTGPSARLSFGETAVDLRGRIDRIDRGPRGLRVVDYKSGRHAELRFGNAGDLDGGQRLQLPLYARALAASTDPAAPESRAEFAAVFGAYWRVDRPSMASRLEWSPEDFSGAARQLEVTVEAMVRGMAQGEFFQVERDKFCDRSCDFGRICGPSRRRLIANKAADPRVVRALEWRDPGGPS